jgi:hypothetical protein
VVNGTTKIDCSDCAFFVDYHCLHPKNNGKKQRIKNLKIPYCCYYLDEKCDGERYHKIHNTLYLMALDCEIQKLQSSIRAKKKYLARASRRMQDSKSTQKDKEIYKGKIARTTQQLNQSQTQLVDLYRKRNFIE